MLSLCLAALFSYSVEDLIIKDGDRIVMIGGALIEREQQFSYVEVTLHAMFPDKKFTVRNLGWSGDTVWGEARAEFGTQAEGYKKLVEQVKACKPTVLILGYGTNEAFAGKAGVEKFAKQYRKLIEDIAPKECRFIFFSIPTPTVKTSPSFAQAEYDQAIRSIASQYQGTVVNLDKLLVPMGKDWTRTDDGILPNGYGYLFLAELVSCIRMDRREGRFSLEQWEAVRKLIMRKNELYFHQYRPQNDTYLFLFRKHEQGNNAVEIPKFTPLIEELDKQINELKQKK